MATATSVPRYDDKLNIVDIFDNENGENRTAV